MLGEAPIQIARDKQVQMAVPVIVEEAGRSRPSPSRDAGSVRDVGKGAVPVVAVERTARIARDVQVHEPVVVKIARGDTHPVYRLTPLRQASCRGDVREGAVRILPIEAIPVFLLIAPQGRQSRSVDEKNIQQTVAVVIQQGDAAAHGFEKILLHGG